MIEFDCDCLPGHFHVGDDGRIHADPEKDVYSIKFNGADDVLVLMHHQPDSRGIRCWEVVEAGEFDPYNNDDVIVDVRRGVVLFPTGETRNGEAVFMTDAEREENKSHSDYQYRHAAYESYVLMETMSEAMRVIVDVLIDGIDRLRRVKCENEVHRCHKCDVEHELEHAVALLDRLSTAADRFDESGARRVLERELKHELV